MNKDLISIIIPVYNTDKYLEECLESIRNQTYSNIEVLLINDESTDNSKKICNKYVKLDKRFKLINIKKSGVSTARNTGIKESKGKYISFIDADDYVEKEYIEVLYKNLISNKVDISRVNNYMFKDKIINTDSNGNYKDGKYNISKELVSDFMIGRIRTYLWLMLIKKEKVVNFDKNISYLEDSLFYLEVLKKCKSIYISNDRLYYYRVNNSSITKNYNNAIKNIDDILYISKIVFKSVDSNSMSKIYNNYFTLIVNKLDILIVNKIKIEKDLLNRIKEDIVCKCDIKKMNIIKKIELVLFKRSYRLFSISQKIKRIIRK